MSFIIQRNSKGKYINEIQFMNVLQSCNNVNSINKTNLQNKKVIKSQQSIVSRNRRPHLSNQLLTLLIFSRLCLQTVQPKDQGLTQDFWNGSELKGKRSGSDLSEIAKILTYTINHKYPSAKDALICYLLCLSKFKV